MSNNQSLSTLIWLILGATLTGCNGSNYSDTTSDTSTQSQSLTSLAMVNKSAYIPPQCYTKTIDNEGAAHNPCYTCHLPSDEPNYINDGELQRSYSFAEYANTNHWSNLFENRSQQVAAIGDEEIISYVRQSNYFDDKGELTLTNRLDNLTEGWDYDGDGIWDGYTPDCYFNFNAEGFDTDLQGELSGWRAYASAPFLGTFWPTNGSTDDVLIRLPELLRQDVNGKFDLETYRVNLAIVEALIKREDITLEQTYREQGIDLDKDGNSVGLATQVTYDWAPTLGRNMSYVGMGATAQQEGSLHLAAGLFPEGTEFLHSVRYIDVDDQEEIGMAARMKELRYARKTAWLTYSKLQDIALNEIKEKSDFPDRLKEVAGNLEQGISNRLGWLYQGFIEDANGELRPQTYEESVFCVGCHGGIGATTDTIFSFPRKFDSSNFQAGWYHWSQKSLRNQPEPIRSDGNYEYTYYLEQNQAGDEFRTNSEVMERFFDATGALITTEVKRLHDDVTLLLYPSRDRALTLNKAYRVIVMDQDFNKGRDATVSPPDNIHKSVVAGQETGVTTIVEGP